MPYRGQSDAYCISNDSTCGQSTKINKFVIMQFNVSFLCMPIPVAVLSKAWVFGRSLARILRSNPTGGMDVCLL
jgi:hypothetical protein